MAPSLYWLAAVQVEVPVFWNVTLTVMAWPASIVTGTLAAIRCAPAAGAGAPPPPPREAMKPW